MTELMRPVSMRALLDCLPRATLVSLCEIRGLPVSRANDACRRSLARSFRGQRDEFFSLLKKDDLVHLFEQGIWDNEVVYELPDAYGYSKKELVELAIWAFGRLRDLTRPFVRRTGIAATPASDPPPSSGNGEGEPLSGALAGVAPSSSGWSRPRPLRALLAQLGLPVESTLSQEDFAALIEAIEARGFEVATVDGTRLSPLHDAVSIDAELRLRHDALAAPTTSHHGGAETTSRREVETRDVGNYERACLRIELLTASAVEAPRKDGIVEACVERATAGLSVDEAMRAVLRAVAQRLLALPRDPFVVLNHLSGRLDAEDGEVLVQEYCSVHVPDPETAALLRDHWNALSAPTEPDGGHSGAFE